MTATEYTKTNADLMKILKNGTGVTSSMSVTGASVKNYTDFKTTKLLDQNIKDLTISDTAAAIVASKSVLKADSKITATQIKDSIANIVKAVDVKSLMANAAGGSLSATISVTDTKTAVVSIANAIKVKDLSIDMTKISITDTAANFVTQKNNEVNVLKTGVSEVLAGIGSTGGPVSVAVTNKGFITSIADIKTLKSVSADLDISKLSYKISDTTKNIVTDKGDASVMNAAGIIFSTNVTVADDVALGDLTQKLTPGSLTIYDTVANVTAKSADDLAALKAKGFNINVADTATHLAGQGKDFAAISAKIANINDIVFDGDQNPETNVADTVAADKKFATGTVLTGHSDVLGHVVTPGYSVAS